MSFENVRGAIEDTISISMFNRGLAGKIFEDVRHHGAKVVMKNNMPECVLLSPEEYIRLLDEVNDARLLAEAQKRMEHFDLSRAVSHEEADRELGLEHIDANDAEGVEFE